MKITADLSDDAVLAELGARLARQRRDAGLTQAQLAEQAGVSKRTLERLEAGYPSELVTLIRLLRVLQGFEGLEGLIPQLPPSPLALLKGRGRIPRRVGHSRRAQGSNNSGATAAPDAPAQPWHWGE